VLICQKDGKQGEFSKYQVILALDGANRVITRPLDPHVLAQRYNMAAPATFIDVPTEQQLVDELVGLLNMRSPKGYHEYALLREAFPQFRVPEPPSAPAAMPTIPGASFGGSPIANGIPGIPGMVPPPMQGGYPAIPGMPAPARPAIPGMPTVPQQPYAAPGAAPTYPQGYGPGQMAPGYPAAPVGGTVPGYPAIPGMPTVPPVQAAPVVQPPQPAPVGEMAGVAANAAAAMPSAPIAPGDPVGGAGFNRDAFLNQLGAMGK